MSEEKELKLACLHQAGGDLDHAQRLFDWVSGSVRATPDSEAAEVSAPKQDKPQQSFNYRHPSKYGTDVPRRCYLEELTPEERAIRDLVDTVERLGAHPLLTATVIQLMKAGEDLADWVDIGLRDKDIAALSPGNDLGLLDENPAAGVTEVRNQAEGEAPLWQVHEISSDDICAVPSKEIGEAVAAWGNVTFAPTHEYDPHINFVVEPWAGDAETHEVDLGASWLAQYAFNMRGEPIDWLNNPPRGGKSEPEGGKGPSGGEPSADAERTEDALLENQPGVSSQASLAEATRKAELEEANRGEIIRKIAAANAYHEVRFGDRWRVGSELENQPGVSDEGTPVLDAWPEVNGGSMLIVDDLPTMKRADLPLDAETFKGHGIETARVNGVTYLVTDEPERIAETSPAQAYDTAHEEAEPSIDAERTPESQSTDGIDRVEQQSPAAYGGWVFWKRSA